MLPSKPKTLPSGLKWTALALAVFLVLGFCSTVYADSDFTLTVTKGSSVPLTGKNVYVFTGTGSYTGTSGQTDGSGQVTFSLADGDYKFRTDTMGYQYWTPVQTVPTTLAYTHEILHVDVTITVEKAYLTTSETLSGVNTYLFKSSGSYVGLSDQTDGAGEAVFNVPPGDFKVRADYLSKQVFSSIFDQENRTITFVQGKANVTFTHLSSGIDGINTYVFSAAGSYLGISGQTSGGGLVSFILPTNTYKFRCDYMGHQYWSSDTALTQDTETPVSVDAGGGTFTLTVTDGTNPLVGFNVYLFKDSGSYLGMSGQTNQDGEVAFYLATGNFKFRVDELGQQFWTPVQAVPGTLAYTFAIPHVEVTITVEKSYLSSTETIAGVNTYLFTEGGSYLGQSAQTDSQGEAVYTLPAGNYKVRADWLAKQVFSDVFDNTQTDVTITFVQGQADVTFLSCGQGKEGANTYVFTPSGSYLGVSGQTGTGGLVSFQLPTGQYKFRCDYQSNQYWSDVATLIQDTATAVTVDGDGGLFTLTVTKGGAQPLIGANVYLFSGAGSYLGEHGVTDSNGQVSFGLSDGDFKFRVDTLGHQYWTPIQSVPESLSYTFEIFHVNVTIIVDKTFQTASEPLVGVNAYLFTAGGSYMGVSSQTNSSGEVVFNVPAGDFKVRADWLSKQVFSADFNQTNTTITFEQGRAQVTVMDETGELSGVNVYVFTETGSYLGISGQTGSPAVFTLPANTYLFRADYLGAQYWSYAVALDADMVTNVLIRTYPGRPCLAVVQPPNRTIIVVDAFLRIIDARCPSYRETLLGTSVVRCVGIEGGTGNPQLQESHNGGLTYESTFTVIADGTTWNLLPGSGVEVLVSSNIVFGDMFKVIRRWSPPFSAAAVNSTNPDTPSGEASVVRIEPNAASGLFKTQMPFGFINVDQAYVEFTVIGSNGSGPLNSEAIRLLGSWDSSTVTWNTIPAIGEQISSLSDLHGNLNDKRTLTFNADGYKVLLACVRQECGNGFLVQCTSGTTGDYVDLAGFTYPGNKGPRFVFRGSYSIEAVEPPLVLQANAGDTAAAVEVADLGQAGLKLFRSLSENSGYEEVTPATTWNGPEGAIWLSDSGLINGTAYYFRVIAEDAMGDQSAYSATVSVTPGVAELVSIEPGSTPAGTVLPVTFFGKKAHFVDGTSTVSVAGATGLTFGQMLFIAENLAFGEATADALAATGTRDVSIDTNDVFNCQYNESTTTAQFDVTAAPPAGDLWVQFAAPTQDQLLGTSVTITIDYGDQGVVDTTTLSVLSRRDMVGLPSGTDLAQYFTIGSSQATLTINPSSSFTLPDGENELFGTVEDALGNRASARVHFYWNASAQAVARSDAKVFIGQTVNVNIYGQGFKTNGITQMTMDAGFTVNSFNVTDEQNAVANITVGVVPYGFTPFELKNGGGTTMSSGVIQVGIPFDAPPMRTMAQVPNGGAAVISGVTLPFGEYIHYSEDIEIPGRIRSARISRTWFSGTSRFGAFGSGWCLKVPRLLINSDEQGNIRFYNGRSELFTKIGDNYSSPPGIFAVLSQLTTSQGCLSYRLLYPDGQFSLFDSKGKLLYVSDRHGNTISFQYNSDGLLTSKTDDLNRKLWIEYSPEGFISKLIDFIGREVVYTYECGQLTSSRSPLVSGMSPIIYSYGYDSLNRLNSLANPRGETYCEIQYDSSGKVARRMYGESDANSYYHLDATNRTATIVNSVGSKTEYHFDAVYRNTKVRSYFGRFDSTGAMTQSKISPEYPDYIEEDRSYNSDHLIIKNTMPNGSAFEYVFDTSNPNVLAHGNLLEKKRINAQMPSLHTSMFFTYESAYQLRTTVVNELGHVTTYVYDHESNSSLKGNLIEMRGPTISSGNLEGRRPIWRYSYNDFGQTISKVDPCGRTIEYEYCSSGIGLGRISKITKDPSGLCLSSDYLYTNSDGNEWPFSWTRVRSPMGCTNERWFNEIGRIIRTRSPEITSSAPGHFYNAYYFYDLNGNVIEELKDNTDYEGSTPYGQSSTIKKIIYYNVLDLLIEVRVSPLGLPYLEPDIPVDDPTISTRYEYNKDGNLAAEYNPLNIKREHIYDALGRTYQVVEGANTSNEIATTNIYNDNGYLTKEIGPDGQVTEYIFDGYNRMTKKYSPMGTYTTYSYDDKDRILKEEVFGREDISDEYSDVKQYSETNYEYNEVGAQISRNRRTFSFDGTMIGTGFNCDYTEYDLSFKVHKTIDNNEFSVIHHYDGAGRISLLVDTFGNKRILSYDNNSNVIKAELVEMDYGVGKTRRSVEEKTFDGLNRVTMKSDSFGKTKYYHFNSSNLLRKEISTTGSIIYHSYDQIGRKRYTHTSKTQTPGLEPIYAAHDDGYTTIEWIFDKNSRIYEWKSETNPVSLFVYDMHNRVVQKQDPCGRLSTHIYDDSGNEIQRNANDGSVIISTFNKAGMMIERNIQRGPQVEGPTKETYSYDALHRVISASTFIGSEEKTRSEIKYNSFGAEEEYRQVIFKAEIGGTDWACLTRREYDSSGRVVRIIRPTQRGQDGAVLEYRYDELNRVSDIYIDDKLFSKSTYTGRSSTPDNVEYYSRHDSISPSLLKKVDYENNACEACGDYEMNELVKKIEYSVPGNNGYTVEKFEYEYDSEGRVLSRANMSGDIQYSYNQGGEVTSSMFTRKGNSSFDYLESYSYNGSGSKVQSSRSGVSGPIKTNQYVVDSGGMGSYESINGRSRIYDSSGRLSNDGTYSYRYDYAGRQTSYSGVPGGKREGSGGETVRDAFGQGASTPRTIEGGNGGDGFGEDGGCIYTEPPCDSGDSKSDNPLPEGVIFSGSGMQGICNTRGDEGGRTGPLQIKTPIPGPSPKPEPPPYRGPRDQNPYLDDLAAKSAALDRNYQLEYSDTNLVSSVGNIRQCLCGCGRREITALITDRLGFLYGEFDLDRGEMRNQIGYSVTLEPHFQKIASSGKVHNSAINALGNIEVRIRKTAFIENSSPSLIYSCGIVILGGVAEYTLTRIGSYEEDGEYVTLELDGCPNGWLSGLSYRIILGYNQDNSSLPFARWMSAVCDAPWFVYDMPNDCTYLRIEGLDWNAGIGTEYQISPRYLNDRYINLHGCSSLSFKIADSVEDSNPNNIVLIVEGNITQFLDDSPLIVIGCREIPHNPQYNTNGTYNFNGDTNLYGNLNRQYSPDTGSWTSIDPLGADSNGNYYSYGANSYDNGIDILGLQFTLPQRLINLTESQMEGEIVGYLKELKWTVVIDPSQNVSAGGSKADKGDKVITIGGRLHKNEDNNCGTRWGAAIAQVGFLVHELMEVFLTNEYEMPWQDHRTHNLALLFEMLHVADQLPRYSCRYHRNYHMCDWLERRSNAAGSKNSRAASYNAVKSLYKYLCGGKKPHGGDNQGKKPWEIPQNLKDLVEKQYGMKISGTVHSYQGGGVSSTWEIKGK